MPYHHTPKVHAFRLYTQSVGKDETDKQVVDQWIEDKDGVRTKWISLVDLFGHELLYPAQSPNETNDDYKSRVNVDTSFVFHSQRLHEWFTENGGGFTHRLVMKSVAPPFKSPVYCKRSLS
jgi:hypothetical protein